MMTAVSKFWNAIGNSVTTLFQSLSSSPPPLSTYTLPPRISFWRCESTWPVALISSDTPFASRVPASSLWHSVAPFRAASPPLFFPLLVHSRWRLGSRVLPERLVVTCSFIFGAFGLPSISLMRQLENPAAQNSWKTKRRTDGWKTNRRKRTADSPAANRQLNQAVNKQTAGKPNGEQTTGK